MSYAVLENKLKEIPEEYFDVVSSILDSVIKMVNIQNSLHSNVVKKPYRQLGLLKGQIKIADDFDETPECFKEYM